tara:strand:- start:121 stop:309 length:189 start_codon:yes stop_codon:yes gene_type:complete
MLKAEMIRINKHHYLNLLKKRFLLEMGELKQSSTFTSAVSMGQNNFPFSSSLPTSIFHAEIV